MGIIELFLISLGLAMDAFAVSICKGLSIRKINIKFIIIIGLWFGVFQAIMPIFGFFLGNTFEELIDEIDDVIAFGILTFIGGNMIKEGLENKKEEISSDISSRKMFTLAIATSIDAFTVGITFSLFETNIFFASFLIGIVTFILSSLGVLIGNRFGNKYEKKAQIMGGVILIILGIKNLID